MDGAHWDVKGGHLGTSIEGIPKMREKQDDRLSGGVHVHGCRCAWGVKGEPTTSGSSDLSSGTIKISEHSTCPHEISGGDEPNPPAASVCTSILVAV